MRDYITGEPNRLSLFFLGKVRYHFMWEKRKGAGQSGRRHLITDEYHGDCFGGRTWKTNEIEFT